MSQMAKRESIKLQGDWSVAGITDQLPALSRHLQALREAPLSSTKGPAPLLCLQEVEEIDMSGWQMIAFYVRHLRRLGFAPALVNVREDLHRSIELLGLGRDFHFEPGEGSA